MARGYRDRRRRAYRDLVRQRMEILYRLAVDNVRRGEVDQASRLGDAIWRLHIETRVRMPRWMKRSLCKKCHTPLIPGVSARVRLRSQGRLSYKVIKCIRCGWIHRYPYKVGSDRSDRIKGEGEGEAS